MLATAELEFQGAVNCQMWAPAIPLQSFRIAVCALPTVSPVIVGDFCSDKRKKLRKWEKSECPHKLEMERQARRLEIDGISLGFHNIVC